MKGWLSVDDHFEERLSRIPALRRCLLGWWHRHGRRDIPWKRRPDGAMPEPGQPLDPYGIGVAEVILQQTQLAVVLPPGLHLATDVAVPERCLSSCRARAGWQGLDRLCTPGLRAILRLEVFP